MNTDKLYVTEYSDDLKDFLDGVTLIRAIEILKSWIEEYGEDAKLDISTASEYYSDHEYACVKIVVHRLETDEEHEQRIGRYAVVIQQREQQERAEYERLKAKFGENK